MIGSVLRGYDGSLCNIIELTKLTIRALSLSLKEVKRLLEQVKDNIINWFLWSVRAGVYTTYQRWMGNVNITK